MKKIIFFLICFTNVGSGLFFGLRSEQLKYHAVDKIDRYLSTFCKVAHLLIYFSTSIITLVLIFHGFKNIRISWQLYAVQFSFWILYGLFLEYIRHMRIKLYESKYNKSLSNQKK